MHGRKAVRHKGADTGQPWLQKVRASVRAELILLRTLLFLCFFAETTLARRARVTGPHFVVAGRATVRAVNLRACNRARHKAFATAGDLRTPSAARAGVLAARACLLRASQAVAGARRASALQGWACFARCRATPRWLPFLKWRPRSTGQSSPCACKRACLQASERACESAVRAMQSEAVKCKVGAGSAAVTCRAVPRSRQK